jgi:AcrR family transcriptional regulator
MDLITEQRLARRAAILATAREMIAESGYEAITVRDLAQRCRVSVPTLYNQFGGKDEVLAAAIQEHFVQVLGENSVEDSEPSFECLINVLDRCSNQFLTLATYHQRLLEAFASLDATAAVQRRIASQFSRVIATQLEHLQRKRQLAEWSDIQLLAGQVTNAVIGTAIVWSTGHLDDTVLGPAIRYAAGLVLLGAARGRTRVELEALVVQAQLVLARSSRTDNEINEQLAKEV